MTVTTPETIPELLRRRSQQTPDAVAHWVSTQPGEWMPTSWKEFDDISMRVSIRLHALGLEPGDCVGLMARTSHSWEYAQMAVLRAGGVVVGMDPHDLDEHLDGIARTSGLSAVILEEPGLLSKLTAEVREDLKFIVVFTGYSENQQGCHDFSALIGGGENVAEPTVFTLRESDPATIVFTSGTTGTPKGIEYSHGQVLAACDAILEAFPDIQKTSHLACWLPLSNLFQRMINFCAIGNGAQTYFVDDPRRIMAYLSSINPHIFIAVPRFFEKLHDGMMEQLEKQNVLQRGIANLALAIGDRRARAIRKGVQPDLFTALIFPLLDKMVLARFRAVLGTNLQFLVSGSAAMPGWLLERFHAMGLLVLEAYGMSENIVPIAVNRPGTFRFGTVGKVLKGNEVKLAKDNELLVRGKGVFSGYYRENASFNRFTPEGYLLSGDYAEIDGDGFIRLTGRKSEIFKTSTGRRISPMTVEERLRKLPFVEHAVVFGAGHKFLVAVVSLTKEMLSAPSSGSLTKAPDNDADLILSSLARLRMDFKENVNGLPEYKQPAGLILTTRVFTISNKELTSNLKIRRRNVEANYHTPIESLYERLEGLIGTSPIEESIDDDVVICTL